MVYSTIYKLLQAEKRAEEMRKLWVQLGEQVGLVVVEDDVVEQDNEENNC